MKVTKILRSTLFLSMFILASLNIVGYNIRDVIRDNRGTYDLVYQAPWGGWGINLSRRNLENLDGLELLLEMTGRKPEDIVYINLNENRLTKLPDNFLQNYPNLRELRLGYNSLTQLPDNFLQNCPKLLLLDLRGNQLTQLPNNFLKNSPKLRILGLKGNPIPKELIDRLVQRIPIRRIR